jgi:hypothetical protein
MKLIMADFMRRWWGVYLLAALFVGMIDAVMDLKAGSIFVGIFMVPFAFELGRRPVGVLATLPVRRKTVALSYWCLAVLLPVLLMAGTMALVVLLFPSVAFSWKSAATILFSSLALTGASYCSFTGISLDETGSDPGDFLMMLFMGLWFPATVFGGFLPTFFEITEQNPVAYLSAALLGLILTALGYSRSEKLVCGRPRKRPGGAQTSAPASRQIPAPKPGMARFGGVLFAQARFGFFLGLFCPAFLLIFRMRFGEGQFFWPWLFAFCTLASAGLLSGGARLLRSLPLSAGHLAWTLLFLPISGILGVIAALGMLEFVFPGHFFAPSPCSFLIPMAGAVCFASSLFLPFGGRGDRFAVLPLAMLASFVIFDTVENARWPSVFWWLLGLSLIVAAFFLNRHWLRSSHSYRPSTGGIPRR